MYLDNVKLDSLPTVRNRFNPAGYQAGQALPDITTPKGNVISNCCPMENSGSYYGTTVTHKPIRKVRHQPAVLVSAAD